MSSNFSALLRLLTARLSRRIAFWVFFSIILIEIIILVPSVQRYEQQQLNQLQQTSAAMLPLMMQLTRYTASDDSVLTELSRLQLNPVVMGGALYDHQQHLIGTFGESPALNLLKTGNRLFRKADGTRYDVVWSAQLGRNYTLVLRHDASHIRTEVWHYIGRIIALILLISLFVTIATMLILSLFVIAPMLLLRRDLFSAGNALSRDEPAPLFASSQVQFRDELADVIQAFHRMFQQVEQANSARRQAEQKLRQRNEELDTFAHTVAHDLKNPVNAILGYSELLQDEYQTLPKIHQTEDGKIYINEIRRATLKMQEIIEALLLLAGVSKRKVELHEMDMERIVQEVEHRLAYMMQEYQGQLYKPTQWPAALGYAPWIEEVWANYISNALKYGGHPPIIEVGATFEGKHQIKFWVKDNGPGLSSEAQQRLFSAFTQLEQHRGKGHGLGLSIVQQVVYKLGGRVGVASETGQGSMFYFILPAVMNSAVVVPE